MGFKRLWKLIIMVEGINARMLFHANRMTNLVGPGSALLLIGLIVPMVMEEVNEVTGRFTVNELNIFNGIFSVIMGIGLTLIAYGLTYRRKGDVVVPIVMCILLLCSIDLFIWVYYVWLNWIPGPSGIFILPFAPPGDIPLLLTLFFLLLIILARLSYYHDPRNSGRPKYYR